MVDWIETFLAHGEGDVLGKPVQLDPFWRYIFTRKYEYNPHTGRQLYDQVYIGLPKGNMKTEGMGFDADARLVSPFAPHSPNIVLSAAAWAQTKRLFNAASLGLTGGLLKSIFSEKYILEDRIRIPGQPGVMSRIAAIAGTNDGGLESDHYADELHELVSERQERTWLVMGNSLAKRTPRVRLPSGIDVTGHQQVGITTGGASMDSLAGRLYAKGVRLSKGEEVDPRFLFLWWEADDSWDLETEDGLLGAILQANPGAGSFLSVDNLVDRFGDIALHEFRRYHLNRWVAAPDSWITYESWQAQAHPDITPDMTTSERWPAEGTEIWAGFDGSKSRDSTALIGCTAGGYIFEIAAWDRPLRSTDWLVPRSEVDAAVALMMSTWRVRRLSCDPPRWEREIEDWEAKYTDDVVVRFDTDVPQRFAPAVGRFEEAFRAERLTNDGSDALARHVGNARIRETRWGLVITKEHKDSPRRIDRAVAAVLAYDGVSSPPEKAIDRTIRGYA